MKTKKITTLFRLERELGISSDIATWIDAVGTVAAKRGRQSLTAGDIILELLQQRRVLKSAITFSKRELRRRGFTFLDIKLNATLKAIRSPDRE